MRVNPLHLGGSLRIFFPCLHLPRRRDERGWDCALRTAASCSSPAQRMTDGGGRTRIETEQSQHHRPKRRKSPIWWTLIGTEIPPDRSTDEPHLPRKPPTSSTWTCRRPPNRPTVGLWILLRSLSPLSKSSRREVEEEQREWSEEVREGPHVRKRGKYVKLMAS